MLAGLGSAVAGLMFAWAMFQQYFPHDLRRHIEKYTHRLLKLIYPYIQITFNEYGRDHFGRSEIYSAIETYLASNSAALHAKRLTAAEASSSAASNNPNSPLVLLTIANHEEVEDEFEGVKFSWSSSSITPERQFSFSFYPPPDEKRFYKLSFHKRHRDLVISKYLNHVIKEGKAIKQKNRQRKLYTNYGSRWNSVVFQHPATFESIAMEADRKEEIIEDLIAFSRAEDFYARIGKAWKRGYLLYGPPGTGKSTMVAAIANLLSYDVYDLELTAVKDNTELRKLLIQTSSKSLVVIEDIDCSLDLTGQRKKKDESSSSSTAPAAGENNNQEEIKKKVMQEDDNKASKVTLSGLLNFIDGLWSACKGERLIVFTTNFKEKLDPALIRRGRMDKHVELSYCKLEAFKVLANNYWKLEEHPNFETIGRMLEEVDVTPADVAECLMPKSVARNVEDCLECLIEALEKAKIDAKLKAEEEAKAKAEEEEEKAKKADEEVQAKKAEEEEKAKKAEEEDVKRKEGKENKQENGWLEKEEKPSVFD